MEEFANSPFTNQVWEMATSEQSSLSSATIRREKTSTLMMYCNSYQFTSWTDYFCTQVQLLPDSSASPSWGEVTSCDDSSLADFRFISAKFAFLRSRSL